MFTDPFAHPLGTRRLDGDARLAVVKINDLPAYKARHGLRTIGAYWPEHAANPTLYV